ncbi:hypothetical protein SBC1_05200 [Caballeronia sp. SBC1]|nr:hypothetical protein SBC1_05200 [Caballeronia sp. SBC1]
MRFPGLFLGCGNDRLQPFSACHQIQIEPVDLLAYTSNMSSEALVNPNLTNARIQGFFIAEA